jgi:hypothetical protein
MTNSAFAVVFAHCEDFAVAFAAVDALVQPSRLRHREAFAVTLREPLRTARPRRVRGTYRDTCPSSRSTWWSILEGNTHAARRRA